MTCESKVLFSLGSMRREIFMYDMKVPLKKEEEEKKKAKQPQNDNRCILLMLLLFMCPS